VRARPAGWPARGNDPRAKLSRLADAPAENRNSLIVGAVLCEINDDWTVVRRYMTINREEEEVEVKALKPSPKKHAA
jgi:hypothetical protein